MIIILLLLFLFIVSILFVPIRLVLFHPVLTVKYLILDIYHYFKYKLWRVYKTGRFDCFDSASGRVFGSGKTLSCVYQLKRDYKKYNDVLIYDIYSHKWVTQKIIILTNLTLKNIPFIKLKNMDMILDTIEKNNKNKEDDVLYSYIVLLDECQNSLNNRDFKSNFSGSLLKALTESRHYNMNFIYSCPHFSGVDLILRQCTSLNYKNNKIWRFQLQSVYDAQDVENATNINLVKPFRKTGFFVEDDLFSEYDTKEIIDNVIKAKKDNNYLSDKEIIDLQGNSNKDINAINHKSKIAKNRLKM